MAELIPFTTGDNNYRLAVPLDGTIYLFDVRWNSSDASWYMNILTEDEVSIADGVKLVLGNALGKHNPNLFFQSHLLKLVDTSGKNRDAGYDDLGTRVVLLHELLTSLGTQ